jgi:Zn-dependent protease
MDPLFLVIFIGILLFSVIFHEVAHGLMAEKLGDPTAKYAGRLTLNPIPHIDPIWSLLLPAVLVISGSPVIFGAAKPVPVDYRNLSNFRRDMFLVSFAGPMTNFILAGLAAISIQLTPGLSGLGLAMLTQTVVINLVLGFFNLLPIPPLDGSKVLASILGYIDRNLMYKILELERYGFIILIIFLFTGMFRYVLIPPVDFFLRLLIGRSLF